MHKTRCQNLLYKFVLGHLPKTSSQILFLADANKEINPKLEKSKHLNIKKYQKERSSKDTRN